MIMDSYIYALLSEAAYADLEGIETSAQLVNALVDVNGEVDPDKGFSQIQAEDFVRHWRVAHHLPNTSTGFSATVFESLDNQGEFVFAMRGTELTTQLGTDLVLADIADIGADGIALNQAIDLFNYYQRLITPEDQLVHQYMLYEGTEPPPEGVEYLEYDDDRLFTDTQYRYLVTVEPMQGEYVIPDTIATIDITGHSLGGHLALILSRLDPGRTGQVYTYNAPGFDTGIIGSDDTEWFFRAMAQMESNHTGSTTVSNFPVNIIDNLVAAQDIISEIGHLPGSITPFDNEGENWLSAHSMRNVTDVLAVCSLFSALDPYADLADDLTPIYMATSWKADHSLEEWVRSLSQLLGISNSLPAIDDRQALYQGIYAIESRILVSRTVANPQVKPEYQNLHVESLTSLTQEQIITHAIDDIAFRYALTHLNAFAITGRDTIYEDHNQNGELDLFDPVTQTGELTQAYLQDRSHYLQVVMQRNEMDVQYLTATSGDGELYWDAAAGQFMSVPEVGTTFGVDTDNLVHYRFGGDDDENNGELDGRNKNDRIYGGGGNDTLNGNAGDDYLEGNRGVDILHGGVGDDALYGNSDNDTLNGGDDRDLLVGGSGQDVLSGDDGIDVLAGDIGWISSERGVVELQDDGEVDILRGGEGDDLYFAGVGDIINDSDGRGNVCVSMILRDGSQQYVQLGLYNIRGTSDPNIYIEHNAYHDLDIEYRLESDGTLVVNDDVRIENFQDTQLGIALDFPSGTSLRYDSYWWNWFADGQYGWVHNTVDQYYASYDVPWSFPARAFVDSRLETERLLALSWELVLGDDATIVHGTDRDDPIHGNEWDDNIQGGEGDDTIDGGAGNDWLNGNEGSDQLNGGEGADQLFGGAGNDTLDGGAGGDRLLGGDGDDILYASDGDVLRGDRGSDRYLYGPGAGDVWIENYDFDQASEDVLQFLAGIQPSDVTLSREIDDLVLTIQGDHVGSVTVRHYFANFDDSENAFTAIEFSDGTRWDRAWISNWLDETGGGNDVISGTNEADVLEGHAGDDQLSGSAGDDTLLGGNGNDRLYGENGKDRIENSNGHDWQDRIDERDGDNTPTSGDGNDILIVDNILLAAC